MRGATSCERICEGRRARTLRHASYTCTLLRLYASLRCPGTPGRVPSVFPPSVFVGRRRRGRGWTSVLSTSACPFAHHHPHVLRLHPRAKRRRKTRPSSRQPPRGPSVRLTFEFTKRTSLEPRTIAWFGESLRTNSPHRVGMSSAMRRFALQTCARVRGMAYGIHPAPPPAPGTTPNVYETMYATQACERSTHVATTERLHALLRGRDG